MIIGETYVYVGKLITDKHFSNFIYGQSYKIKSFADLPNTDIYGSDFAVLFENFNYGCISSKFKKYFIPLKDFRDEKIKNILND